jgi:2-haloacid dehalogenase
MPRYDYILLDADGTLFDFDLAEHRALQGVLEFYGYPFTPQIEARYQAINSALWAQFSAGGADQAFQDYLVVERFAALIRELGGEEDPAQMNREYLARLGENGQLLPGAEEFCRKLSGHAHLAIVTNGVASVQRSRLAASPIGPLFEQVFISQELGVQKPRRAFFDQVCAQLGITRRDRAVVVGDSLASDIQGGINAGMDTIWFNPGRRPADPAIPPTWEVDGFGPLEALLFSAPSVG